jgi:hypothetical protein
MKTHFTLLSVAILFLLTLNWNNALSQSKSKFPSSGVQSADGALPVRVVNGTMHHSSLSTTINLLRRL